MAISKAKKEALVDSLMVTLAKTNRLEIVLRFQGEGKEATKVQARGKELSKQIDKLLAKIMLDWLGQAAALETSIKATNTKLQGAIRDIKKKIQVAQRVIKAIGHIDDVIDFGKRLLN